MARILGRAPVPEGEPQPTRQASTLQIEDLENVCWRYPFPWGTVVALPEEGAKMTDDFAPFFPISIQALEAGFRLPLTEVGVQLCCQMGVAPGQLHPNTWRHIVAFIARCQELGRDPAIKEFVQLHKVASVARECGLYSLRCEVKTQWKHPDSISEWRWKWLLVRPPVGVQFPVSFGVARPLVLPLRTVEGVKALKDEFTTLVPGAEPQPSGPAFDSALLENLGLSLQHFPLGKSFASFPVLREFALLSPADISCCFMAHSQGLLYPGAGCPAFQRQPWHPLSAEE